MELDKGREDFENFGSSAEKPVLAGEGGSDLGAGFEGGAKIFEHGFDTGRLVEPEGILKMVVEGAKIEIDSAAECADFIGDGEFGMNKAGLIFVDFDAVVDEVVVVRTGHEMDEFFVRDTGGDEPD